MFTIIFVVKIYLMTLLIHYTNCLLYPFIIRNVIHLYRFYENFNKYITIKSSKLMCTKEELLKYLVF